MHLCWRKVCKVVIFSESAGKNPWPGWYTTWIKGLLFYHLIVPLFYIP
ncbi:hypothetical protein HMPREF0322_04337 [Desulfitobacterium hafniense DP7]|uniref:Uncharacterized protein n=1 Tax=Desulfitobacterium hafniense DP7 TaxID=537010 RepID=G9XTN0_DESHA|nr:hypothetical protein HMPREF0322_04337 [Desulfitobacterium hafniense DP7]